MKRGVVAVIPCRYGSTRFPGKPLADILGRPMIERTYRSALKSKLLERVYIASDSEVILSTAKGFGAPVIKTSSSCETGTERVEEAVSLLAGELRDDQIIVNVQGDEPLISADHIDTAVRLLQNDSLASMSTVAVAETDQNLFHDPNVVKVVKNSLDYALYFSRSPLPFQRNPSSLPAPFLRHIGLYAFRKEFLHRYVKLPASELERHECLEQLRVLEAGERIKLGIVKGPCYPGVDTPKQLEDLIRLMKANKVT